MTTRPRPSSHVLLRLLLASAVAVFVWGQVGHTIADAAGASRGTASAATSGSPSDRLGADPDHCEDLETFLQPLSAGSPSPDPGQRAPNPIPTDPTAPFVELPEPVPILG